MYAKVFTSTGQSTILLLIRKDEKERVDQRREKKTREQRREEKSGESEEAKKGVKKDKEEERNEGEREKAKGRSRFVHLEMGVPWSPLLCCRRHW